MLRFVCAIALLLFTLPAKAEVPLTGYFTATKACPALQSISRETNPGNIAIRPGTAYDLIAGNKDRPTHLWIVVPGAEPDRRWVAVDCGTRSTDAEGRVDEPPSSSAASHLSRHAIHSGRQLAARLLRVEPAQDRMPQPETQ